MANEPVWSFYKNRLLVPQKFTITIFKEKFVNLISKNAPCCIFNVFLPSGRHSSYFSVIIIIRILEDPRNVFWTQLGKLEFFRKIDIKNIKGTFEVILMLKFFIRGRKTLLRLKVKYFYGFWKQILPALPYNLKGTFLGVEYQKFGIFVYWYPHRTIFELPTTFQIK